MSGFFAVRACFSPRNLTTETYAGTTVSGSWKVVSAGSCAGACLKNHSRDLQSPFCVITALLWHSALLIVFYKKNDIIKLKESKYFIWEYAERSEAFNL